MTTYLISCENATCAVPEAYREIFRGQEEVLTSSEGWEPGSLNLAQGFAMKLRTPLVHGDVTRLLMDFEKDGEDRWSRFSLTLPEATRNKIVDRHARPYLTMLHQRISEDLRRYQSVLHLIVHTHPEPDGRVRMETPKGAGLAETIAMAWGAALKGRDLDAVHVPNATPTPLAAGFSGAYPAAQYAQIRLSVSQSFFLDGRPLRWETLKKLLLETLQPAVESVAPVSVPESPSTLSDPSSAAPSSR